MPRINLLPWREAQRNERKVAFLVSLGAAFVGALVATGAAYIFFGSLIDSQETRNAQLKEEILMLDKQIEKINSLEEQKNKFVARMQVIEKLQRARPEIVHLFDELARTVPDGAYLTGIKQTAQRLRIDGVAQSSTRVSAFMRNIDSSQWLRKPELDIVETKANQSLGASFTLFADQVTVTNSEDENVAKKPARNRFGGPGGAP